MSVDRSSGKFQRVGGSVCAIDIDCSAWPRASSGLRSAGKLVRATQGPPTSRPQEGAKPQSVWLELVVSFSAGVPGPEAWLQVNRLLKAVTSAAPGLQFSYDPERSRAENGDLILALASANPAGVADQVASITGTLRLALGKDMQLRGVRLAA